MIEERAILAALERIARMQDSIRSGMDICRDTGLVFLRVYYEQLPPNVARRLTELHAEDMAEIPRATSTEGTAQDRQRLGEKLASDAATAQVMRAMDVYTADFYLRKAIMATVGPELHEVTSEQVGILKLMKLAVETDRFMQQLKTEGREQYSIGEYVEKVYNPVMNL